MSVVCVCFLLLNFCKQCPLEADVLSNDLNNEVPQIPGNSCRHVSARKITE